MSQNSALSRPHPAVGLFAVGLLAGLSACHHPGAYFQPSHRAVFYSSVVPTWPDSARSTPARNAPDKSAALPATYAQANLPTELDNQTGPVRVAYPATERIGQHQQNARRLLTPTTELASPVPVSEHQPGPKPKKTLREILGLPPRKKRNWWQRISWQLKSAVIVILVAVVFAILNITILAIIFGVIGALLLIRGLKKSFKVRRGIFGLGG